MDENWQWFGYAVPVLVLVPELVVVELELPVVLVLDFVAAVFLLVESDHFSLAEMTVFSPEKYW